MGKIIGIAMVGLTQFMLWILLTGFFLIIFQSVVGGDLSSGMQSLNSQNPVMAEQASADFSNDQFAMVMEIQHERTLTK